MAARARLSAPGRASRRPSRFHEQQQRQRQQEGDSHRQEHLLERDHRRLLVDDSAERRVRLVHCLLRRAALPQEELLRPGQPLPRPEVGDAEVRQERVARPAR